MGMLWKKRLEFQSLPDPTWIGLGKTEGKILEEDGGPLWHMLLEARFIRGR